MTEIISDQKRNWAFQLASLYDSCKMHLLNFNYSKWLKILLKNEQ